MTTNLIATPTGYTYDTATTYRNFTQTGPDTYAQECTRCNGRGTFGPKHVADGVCFGCNGTGHEATYTLAELTKRANRAAASKRAYDRKRAAAEAASLADAARIDAERAEAAAFAAEAHALWIEENAGVIEADHAAALEENARFDGQHIAAAPGEKFTLSGVVTKAFTFERDSYSGYGTEYVALIEITAPDHTRMITFTTAAWAYDLISQHSDENPADITVTGKVKKHGTNRHGQRQTVANYVKPAKA